MMRKTLFALVLFALAGCDSAQKAAEYAIAAKMPDPASARFRNVRINHEGVVCGEVDGKEKSGRMTGFREFMYYSHTGHALLGPENVSDAAIDEARQECRAAAGSAGEQTICARVEKIAASQRKLDDFRTRYTTDCL